MLSYTWIKNGAGRLRGHTQGRDASSFCSFRCVCVCVCVCVFVSLVVPLIDCLLAWLCLARFVSLGLASFLMRLR